MEKNPRINVSFDPDTYEQIKHFAARENKSMSEVVRNWSIEGLNGELNTKNIAFITELLRGQLQDVMQPYVNRLAALSAKTCIQAGTAAYLSAEAILKFVPLKQQQEVEISYELARKKAVAYLKGKTDDTE